MGYGHRFRPERDFGRALTTRVSSHAPHAGLTLLFTVRIHSSITAAVNIRDSHAICPVIVFDGENSQLLFTVQILHIHS
eukprot:3093998-Prymnesium_polylepis.1